MEDAVQKALAQSQDTLYQPLDKSKRGLNVYTLTQLLAITGTGRDGSKMTGYVEQPVFFLSIDERINIARLSTPVFGIVTNRMNVVSGLKWKVICEKEKEDDLASRYKDMYQMVMEFKKATDMKYIVARVKMQTELIGAMPDLLPDMSNFNTCLFRWSKNLKKRNLDEAQQVEDWLLEPNAGDKWEDFVKKYVFDLHVHGAAAIYKEKIGNRVENFYVLAGGMCMPLKSAFVGGYQAYVQLIPNAESLIYFNDEISYANYMPTTARAYGLVPLEALINKIAESLLFDRLMADQADGTKPPEKMVLVTDNNPFGDMDKEYGVPIDVDEQVRLEQKINAPKKNAIITFSGNSATVVDLSRENTMGIQITRQKDIREEVALVFNASNMEMNLSGSDNTSGRSTSEAQAVISEQRGIKPIIQKLATQMTRDIIPYRFGTGFRFEFEAEKDELEKAEIIQRKMASGIYSVNEIRKTDLSLDPFESSDGQFDKPANAAQAQQPPDGSQMNPMNVKPVGGGLGI